MKPSRFNIFFKYEDGVVLGYNSSTMGLLELNERDYQAYLKLAENKKPNSLKEKEIQRLEQELTRGKFLIEDDIDELTQAKARYNTDRFLSKSISLTIETTHNCNLACTYCYQESSLDSLKEEMIPVVVQFIESLVRERGAQSVSNTWYGGEPLLNKRFLFACSEKLLEMLEKEKVEHYKGNIVTNGTLLTREVAQSLKQHKVISASITLDGPPEIHDRRRIYRNGKGTFWQIINNIKQACDFLRISIRVSVDVNNVDNVEGLLDILEKEGLKEKVGLGFAPVIAYTKKCSEIEHECFSFEEFARIELSLMKKAIIRGFGIKKEWFLPSPTRTSCGVLSPYSAIIDAKGMIQKCWNALCYEEEALGKIVKTENHQGSNGYVTVLSQKDNRSKWLAFDPFSFEKCRNCEILPTCLGGCPWAVVGMKENEPRCGTRKYYLKEYLWLYRELLKTEQENKEPKEYDSSHQKASQRKE